MVIPEGLMNAPTAVKRRVLSSAVSFPSFPNLLSRSDFCCCPEFPDLLEVLPEDFSGFLPLFELELLELELVLELELEEDLEFPFFELFPEFLPELLLELSR